MSAHPRPPSIQSDSDPSTAMLQEQARAWAIKLKTGQPTTVDVAAFHAWRNCSDRHAWAWGETCKDWAALGESARLFEARYPQKIARPSRAPSRRRMFLGAAASAFGATAVVAVIRPPLNLWPSWSEMGADYRTAKGEQRELRVTDRVLVSLNTQTSIGVATANGVPRISLIAGEAAINARAAPCEVQTPYGRLIMADGEVEVRQLSDGQLRVRCNRGSVELHHAVRNVSLGAQAQIQYDADSLGSTVTRVQPAATWRQGIVTFDDLPLAEVIEEINRYRPGRVVLMNKSLASRRFSAKFQVHALDDAINLMEQVLGLKVQRLGAVVVLA